MVSMARPFLADAEFVAKAAQGRADEINTCIACNQACLDHIFEREIATCLVNPFACRETEMKLTPTEHRKRIAVVGAGPAGLACAATAAERGHRVTLFDAASEIGGQFNLARRIPGKEEFAETLRYFDRRLAALGVERRLGTRAAPGGCARCGRGDSRDGHRSAATGDRGPRAPECRELRRHRRGTPHRRAQRRDHRRRRHRLRRRGIPDARRSATDGHASAGALHDARDRGIPRRVGNRCRLFAIVAD